MSGSAPRLVATDLDGTLLGDDGLVSAYTREVLADLDERGVPVIFTTGRPIRWMAELRDHVGAHGLAICSNGGIVYDMHADEVRRLHPVPREVGLQMVDLLRASVPDVVFAVETATGWASEAAFPHHPDDRAERPTGELADLFGADVAKVLAVGARGTDPEEFWREVQDVVGHLVTTTWSSSHPLVEISAAGVTKASTLAVLAADLGVEPVDVVAFGDMPNDLPMLEWAGHACAVANAHPDVLAAADEVVPRNSEDGVAHTLARLFG